MTLETRRKRGHFIKLRVKDFKWFGLCRIEKHPRTQKRLFKETRMAQLQGILEELPQNVRKAGSVNGFKAGLDRLKSFRFLFLIK